MIDKDGKYFDGYISKIKTPDGKIFKLKCQVTQVHPMTCPKCGGRVVLYFGHGECEYCKTRFATHFQIVEE